MMIRKANNIYLLHVLHINNQNKFSFCLQFSISLTLTLLVNCSAIFIDPIFNSMKFYRMLILVCILRSFFMILIMAENLYSHHKSSSDLICKVVLFHRNDIQCIITKMDILIQNIR